MKIVKFINNLLPKRIRGNDGLIQGLLAAAPSILGNIGGSVASAGLMKGLNSLFGGGEEASVGYDVIKPYNQQEIYANYPIYQPLGSYLEGAIRNLAAGEAPQYWQKNKPKLRQAMSDTNYLNYYGRPGQRTGILNDLTTAGSIGGVGPKAMTGMVSKGLQDYAQSEMGIDQYLASLETDLMTQMAQTVPNQIMSMPGSIPQPQIQPYYNPGSPSLMSQIGSKIPWENISGPISSVISNSIRNIGTPKIAGSSTLKGLAGNIEDWIRS